MSKIVPNGVALSELEEGQIVNGVIKRIEKYGCFIRVQDSSVSGLCHRSQVRDDDGDWTMGLVEGAYVRAVVKSIDLAKGKVGFSLKPSRVIPISAVETDAPGEQIEAIQEVLDRIDAQDTPKEHSPGEAHDDKEEADVDLVLDTPAPGKTVQQTVGPLQLSFGFDFAGLPLKRAIEEDVLSSDEESPAGSAKDAEETNMDRDEQLDPTEPALPPDFERVLLGEPNSSGLWINYMASYLQTSDVAVARDIAQRALRTIHFREEEERLNVWIALLNLENAYGTQEAVENTLNDALQANDAEQVYRRAAEVFASSSRYDRADDIFGRYVKKFSQSAKPWTLYGRFLLERGRKSDARELLARSLMSLPKRKHVMTVSKFAQLEFKNGDPERGRTIFEGILDSHPKRVDIWQVYIDMESRLGNSVAVRLLYDRLLHRLSKPDKVKGAFKRWLKYEKEHGDKAGVNAVIRRATEYVGGGQPVGPTLEPANNADGDETE